MNSLKSSDHSYRFLVAVAVVGLFLSFFGLYYVSYTKNDLIQNVRVAKVVQFKKDTRLKRAGEIQWTNASEVSDCFDNDLVFTGDDSEAVVEFLDGSRITLSSNTLISLSKNHVSLNSGVIEVANVKKDFSIESFGEVFKPDARRKLRIENTTKTKKIVPLDTGDMSFLKVAGLGRFYPPPATIAKPVAPKIEELPVTEVQTEAPPVIETKPVNEVIVNKVVPEKKKAIPPLKVSVSLER